VQASRREAVFADLTQIVAIYNSTIAGRMVTADLEPVSVASREEWFYRHTPDRRPIWVYTIDNQIAGWISFADFHQRPAYAKTAELSIYLAEPFRGQGLGKRMLTDAIATAPVLNIDTLVGRIFAHNTASLRLFTSKGFEKWGHLPCVAEFDGIKRDLIIMGKHIRGSGV
jgi:L-amino acid N-acyltransferase YncA